MDFEDAKISKTLAVYSNGSDEVFVTNRKSGVVVRIGDRGDVIVITASGYNMRWDAAYIPRLVVEKKGSVV